MNKIYPFPFFILFFVLSLTAKAQHTSTSIFAHNDYAQPIPFLNAYHHQVGYIEADLFLIGKELLVAHTLQEIEKERTLEELYLKPLQKQIIKNNGFAYPDPDKTLTIMIDLKSAGEQTLEKLVKKLKKYPELISCPTLQIAVSGNMPAPDLWNNYPGYIHFDGRPHINYSENQLKRVSMISTSFRNHSQWNGKGVLTKPDEEKLEKIIKDAHAKGKKVRFWAAPDFNNAWIQLMRMEADIINTDHVSEVAGFIENLPKNTFLNDDFHTSYQPRHSFAQTGQTPKNIILMIGDGMGLAQLYSGYTANNGQLNIFNIQDIGFSITTASDSYITDSAAGATAMSTGKKTKNRHIGVDSTGKKLATIAETLKSRNFNIAIISNGEITDATPAAFYAHQPERNLSEAIAVDFLSSGVDILIGGGISSFNKRADGQNLVDSLKAKGYTFSESIQVLDTISRKKFIIIDEAASVSKKDGRQDFLPESLYKALSLFAPETEPFFIMAEGAQIDWGGHNNDFEYVVREVLDFDQAVGEAMKFVDEDKETLLIVTADHETGGLSLLGGDISQGAVHGHFSTNDHTAVMVPVFSYGPGAENFRGVYQNTAIYHKILELLKPEP